jgi:hypothetical protein
MYDHKVLPFRGPRFNAAHLAQFGEHILDLQAHVQKRYQYAEA